MVPAPPRRRSPGIHIGAPRILQPPWKSGSWDSTDPPVRAPQPLQSLSPPPAPTASLGAQEGNLSPPGTQASELSARPPRIGETEPPHPWIPDPSQKSRSPDPAVRAPSTPSLRRDLGVLASPLLQEPLGPGAGAPGPRLSDPGVPPSSPPSLKLRVSEAALASPWQQESILRWEHTAPAAAPPHPAPPT